MNNWLRPKMFTIYILVLFDILVVPSLIIALVKLMKKGVKSAIFIFKHFDPLHAVSVVLANQLMAMCWLAFQMVLIGLVVQVFWNVRGTKSKESKLGVGGPDAAGNGQFGTSRFLTEKEILKTTLKWNLQTYVVAGGIVLGAVLNKRNKYAYVDDKDSNSGIIGATRSGKSRRVILPSIWHLGYTGESMLVTDPKGELYARSADYLIGQGYKVRYLDFRTPGRGNQTNYMEPVNAAVANGDIGEASKQAWSIAHMFVTSSPGSNKGEAIWRDGAESVIAALILAVAIEAPYENQKHMYSVYKMLVELGKVIKMKAGNQIIDVVPINDYFESLSMDHPARDAFATAALAPDRTRGSFFTTTASLLRLFSDPNVAYLTSKQDHSLQDLGKEKTAVFLIIPDEDKTRHIYAALYVNQTYDALVQLANASPKERLPIRVNMLLDEFGNMPAFPEFANKLTVSLGRGIRWNVVIQAYGQLVELYGKEITEIIKGNLQNTIYLITNDLATAKDLSERTGKYTVETNGSSYTVQKNQVNHGASSNLTGRPLLMPEEILTLPQDVALVLRGRSNPAILPLPDLSEWPADQELVLKEHKDEINVTKVPFFVANRHGYDQPEEETEMEEIYEAIGEDIEDDGSQEPQGFMDVD